MEHPPAPSMGVARFPVPKLEDHQNFEALAAATDDLKPSPSAKSKTRTRKWSAEEDRALHQAVRVHGGKNWKLIAESLPGRSEVQCLHRWQKVLDPNIVKGPWTTEEDRMLLSLVQELGAKRWAAIAQQLPGRIAKQCRERWHNHLNPDIRKCPFSQEEDRTILEALETYGSRWAEISKLLPGRSDNAIKNRWNSSMKHKIERYFSEKESVELSEAVAMITAPGSPKPGSSPRSDSEDILSSKAPTGQYIRYNFHGDIEGTLQAVRSEGRRWRSSSSGPRSAKKAKASSLSSETESDKDGLGPRLRKRPYPGSAPRGDPSSLFDENSGKSQQAFASDFGGAPVVTPGQARKRRRGSTDSERSPGSTLPSPPGPSGLAPTTALVAELDLLVTPQLGNRATSLVTPQSRVDAPNMASTRWNVDLEAEAAAEERTSEPKDTNDENQFVSNSAPPISGLCGMVNSSSCCSEEGQHACQSSATPSHHKCSPVEEMMMAGVLLGLKSPTASPVAPSTDHDADVELPAKSPHHEPSPRLVKTLDPNVSAAALVLKDRCLSLAHALDSVHTQRQDFELLQLMKNLQQEVAFSTSCQKILSDVDEFPQMEKFEELMTCGASR